MASVLPFFSLETANYYFGVTAGGALIASYSNGSAAQITPLTGTGVLSYAWARVAFVIDSTAAPSVSTSFYSNGALLQAPTVNGGDHSAAFGASVTVAAFAAAALQAPVDLCDVRLYDSALTATQIEADFRDGTPPAGAVGIWPFDDGAGTSARETVAGVNVALASSAAFSADSPMKLRGIVQNFVQDSTQVANTANWINVGLGPTTAAAGPFPAGYSFATVLSNDASTGAHRSAANAQTQAALVVGRKYFCRSVFKRVSGNDYIALYANAGACGRFLRFSTGALGVGGASASLGPEYAAEDLGGGWFALWFSFIATTSAWPVVYMADADGSVSFTHVAGVDQVACVGVQVEEAYPGQTTASPMIVPTGAAPLSVYGAREWRQNFTRYSEDQTVAAHWSSSNAVPTLDGTLTPDGKVATRVADTASNTVHYVAQANPGDGGSATDVRTFIFTAKMDTRRYMAVFTDNGNKGIIVDLQAGAVSNVYGPTGTAVRALGGGWYEFKFRATCSVTGSPTFVVYGSSGPTAPETIYVGNGSAFYVSKCQQLRGDFLATAVDYIKTTAAPANSSGAPKSKAGVRPLAGVRRLAA